MTWSKIGDEFVPASMDLSDVAFRLHVEALCYSNWRLLDLTIPKRAFARYTAVEDIAGAAAELIDQGWWQDLGDEWWVGCRFPEWQRDRSQVEHRREQLALAQRRRRAHLVDDHRFCLNCSSKAASSDDSTVEYDDDPVTGRDGYGSGTTPGPEDERPCRKCQRPTQPWILKERDGHCITCWQARAAS